MKTNQRKPILVLFSLLAVLPVVSATPAAAQEIYTFSAGIMGSLGGSLDAEPGNSFSNTGFQLNFSMVTEPRTHVGMRVGHLALDDDGLFGNLRNADLTYLTVGGEYRFNHGFYDSGVVIGLGGYQLKGDDASGVSQDETTIGLTIGFTGEFAITSWAGLQIELIGHYADFDDQQLFATVNGGLVFHF